MMLKNRHSRVKEINNTNDKKNEKTSKRERWKEEREGGGPEESPNQ